MIDSKDSQDLKKKKNMLNRNRDGRDAKRATLLEEVAFEEDDEAHSPLMTKVDSKTLRKK